MTKLFVINSMTVVAVLLLANHVIGLNNKERCAAQTSVSYEACLVEATR